MVNVTVITPSLPERAELLAEAIASVEAQTLQPAEHKIRLDSRVLRAGPARCRNYLLERTTTEHVAFLDDDDVLYPHHLETLAGVIGDADLAFSWHDGGPGVPRYDSWDASAYLTILNGRNTIPVTVLARRDAIHEAGGFDPADRYEDHQLWLRMLANGCDFVCTPTVTWAYRISENGRTYAP